MNWNTLTPFVLAGFGFLTLVLTQLREVLAKLPELIRMFRTVRRAIDEKRSTAGEYLIVLVSPCSRRIVASDVP
ncbi:hypothetical protein [Streptosporangium lutulentum]|uniref:Uncharacterized protein n=1 Tax=Streptosporangium lutulentum TaxID=1461250 RepID=A0ABT9QT15_9ACTN|nr:hypothetical protein [Streptosporangium lutulentum]MDP9849546.1 hypothetical protein [Streptosporangium lutulentum]